MAEDINKKITIGVELETDSLTQNINSLNNVIDGLLAKQQQLNASGKLNATSFESVTDKLKEFKEKLEEVNKQITTSTSSFNTLNAAAKNLDGTLSSSAASFQKIAKAAEESGTKTKELSQQVNSLANATKQQAGGLNESKSSLDNYATGANKSTDSAKGLQSAITGTSGVLSQSAAVVNQSKSSFDAHEATMKHLKKSFEEVKNVSGIFGPSLKEASEGFSAMKSGLKLVQDGFDGVGTAIKADGFDFLLEILQLMFNAFVKSSEGSKILKGAISAIGVVVNEIKGFFNSFMKGIIEAFSHPVETLKSLGALIQQNLINRFKAFGVILDGIIHLDFKKITNGAVQAFTGVTDATDKIGAAFNTVKNGVGETVSKMVTSYKEGYQKAGEEVDKHEKKVIASLDRQGKAYDKLTTKTKKTYREQNNANAGNQHNEPLTAHSTDNLDVENNPAQNRDLGMITPLAATQKNADAEVKIKETALQQFEDYAKQSGSKLATDALNLLNESIKQQSAAKIASLEKDKASELSNRNLTSAQKLAIRQKYQQQENAIKVKAFKEEQEVSIAQAIINGALAITKGTAQTGVLAALYIPTIIAETAIQVAKITAQKPPAYAKGGLHYNSDGRGGLLPGYSPTDNTNAYLRSGEGIVVSEAMQVPWARNLVSAINVGFGGRDFSLTNPGRGYAVGGIFTDGGDASRYYNQPVNDQKNLANTIAYQMINNFPPVYVDVKDVNNQQNILAQTINRVNL